MKRVGMRKPGLVKKKLVIILVVVLLIIGLVGGFTIKYLFFGKGKTQHYMQNKEAIRLISYLGVGEYEYPEKLGSSYTYGDMRKLFDAAQIPYDKSQVPISSTPGFMPISKEKFETIYGGIVEELCLDRLYSEVLYIYQINGENDREVDGVVYELVNTNCGDFYIEKNYGLDRDFVGKVVKTYISNNEMILCTGYSKETVDLKNAYVKGNKGEGGDAQLVCYLNGMEQTFPYASKSAVSSLKDCVVDIKITNNGVTELVDHTKDFVDAKVTAYDDGILMVEGYENPVVVSDTFNVFKTNGTFKAMKSAGLLLGYDQVKLYINNGIAEAALLEQEIQERKIRVLINNSDYTDVYHNGVIVSSTSGFTVSYGDKVDEYNADQQLEIRNGSKEFEGSNIRVEAKDPDGKITVSSIKRQCGSPEYRGTLELVRDDKGVLLINELPVEEYLYGVVPSEMPVNYELEALKAQAICARAYAYRQMESDTYAQYGAHLDDSVACQVYNNVEENERTNYAVDDTYGVVPCYNNEVIEAFFFSTSCGSTSSNTEVWGSNPEAYLLDTLETEFQDMAEFTSEDSFRTFIDGKFGTDYIEENEPFFRWNVSFTKEELGAIINDNIYKRIDAMSENLLAKSANGEYQKKSINSIGDLVEINVTKRGASGIIMEMEVVGTEETVLVKGQANARSLFNPESTLIHKQDGTTLAGWNTLPSAYYYVEDSGDTIEIRGGGFGHGVGMSQNGANDLAKIGYRACDIITHYYTAVELKDMYKLMGK